MGAVRQALLEPRGFLGPPRPGALGPHDRRRRLCLVDRGVGRLVLVLQHRTSRAVATGGAAPERQKGLLHLKTLCSPPRGRTQRYTGVSPRPGPGTSGYFSKDPSGIKGNHNRPQPDRPSPRESGVPRVGGGVGHHPADVQGTRRPGTTRREGLRTLRTVTSAPGPGFRVQRPTPPTGSIR